MRAHEHGIVPAPWVGCSVVPVFQECPFRLLLLLPGPDIQQKQRCTCLMTEKGSEGRGERGNFQVSLHKWKKLPIHKVERKNSMEEIMVPADLVQ